MAEETLVEEIVDTEVDEIHLVELVEDLRRSNAVLQAETEMFERNISRLDPRDLVPQPDSLGASQSELGAGRRISKVRPTALERLQRLSLGQKCAVALRELDETREGLEKLKESSEKVLQNYKATLEEADIRLAEVKKASYEFDRDLAMVLRDQRGAMVGADKVIRYIEDRMRAKDKLAEKLRLKSATLQVQKRKLLLQLRQKEEMGDALHEVDFQQLKIENSQYLERIDEKNQDLLRLKLLDGNTLQVLNSYKKKLQNTMSESKSLSSDIASRKERLVKIEEETRQVEEERSKAETLNRRLRGQLADYRVPEVMSYITVKAAHSKLEQSVRAWERKVEISEMALKTHTKTWNKRRAAGTGTGPGPMAGYPSQVNP